MSKLVKLATIALSALTPSTAFAQADNNTLPAVACEVSGYDVIIRNAGAGPIAAGTMLGWSVPFARRQGDLTLASALPPGEVVFVSNILGTYLGTKTPCAASIG